MIGSLMAKKVAAGEFKKLNDGDLDAFIKGWTEEATFYYPEGTIASGEFTGKPAIKEWFKRFFDAYPKRHFIIKHTMVQNLFDFTGNNVITVEWKLDATTNKQKDVSINGLTVIEIRGGKTQRVRDYIFDTEAWKAGWADFAVADTHS